ncbi:MAG: hypothetical protein IKY47_02420 [Bacteroidaceae bacterium]|nr:hypothetical protein [Bacteroidaceae bacterium]
MLEKPPFWDVLANILHFLQKKLQKVLEVKKKTIPLHPLSETHNTTTIRKRGNSSVGRAQPCRNKDKVSNLGKESNTKE